MIEQSISDNIIPFFVLGGGMFIAIVAIVGSFISDVLKIKAREKTAQDIAAYVAEGSMTTDEGERLLRAGGQRRKA